MTIKDIVNRDNVNLQNCDQEPIHVPGSVQPHGTLLALGAGDLTIRFCSANVPQFLGESCENLLGRHITSLFSPDVAEALKELSAQPAGRVAVIKTSRAERVLDLICHRSDELLVVETEQPHSAVDSAHLVNLSAEFVIAMEETQTLRELCDLVAVNIRKVTGYDRVMIYRFDKEYNGEVFSESKRQDLEAFIGLHYPHTDIPAQARQLYIRNQLRMIVDVDYEPVPILTNTGSGNTDLDLSLSVLRSVSPIHLQYLHNMGVGATLTISLVLRGKLWGLIACHHYSPKYLSYDVRMSARLLGHFITSQIDTRLLNEENDVRNLANRAVEQFGSYQLALERRALSDIVNNPLVFSICNADGVAVFAYGTVVTSGKTPALPELHALKEATRGRKEFHTDHLASLFDQSTAGTLPGLAYYPLHSHEHDCIMWFRDEFIHEVHWAGDPAKSIEKDKNGLSPRKSFDLWRETVKGHCKPWLASELNAAANFANFLSRHIVAVLLTEEEEKQRRMANDLVLTNAELENINYISTHDLQEPLRKIQMTASLLLGNPQEPLPAPVLEKITKMNQFAGRMQHLIKDILKYTRLNHNHDAFEACDLNGLFSSLGVDLKEALSEKDAVLNIGALPEVTGVPFLLRQLFTNLIHNSLKFASPHRRCAINITSMQPVDADLLNAHISADDYHMIRYADNGIGFGSEQNEKVFKVFTRLAASTEVSGSGIGLAICRKIMQTHKGYMYAEGREGEGAIFRIYFPKNWRGLENKV